MRARAHTHTHARARAHTHTHTHTHPILAATYATEAEYVANAKKAKIVAVSASYTNGYYIDQVGHGTLVCCSLDPV